MLDVITYTQNLDMTIEKTITNTISDIPGELAALQAQLSDLIQGNQSPDVTAAIANYTAQIAFLQGLS